MLPFLAVVFVDTLGYAAVVPLIPFALRSQGTSPVAIGAVFGAYSLCQFIAAPFLGRLSDRIGRRPVLAVSQFGSVLGWALLVMSSAYPVVLLSRVVDGSSAGNLALCYTAVVDSESEDVRRRGVPALGAATGAGIVVGIGLSALLASRGLSAAALVAMAMSLVTLALTAFVVPETRPEELSEVSVSGALRQGELRQGGLFVALCAALQAAFFLTLPPYLARALGLQAQGTTAVIALLVALAAAFQLAALPWLLSRLRPPGAAQSLIAAAVAGGVLVALAEGRPVVLVAAAGLVTAVAALGPVSALLFAEARPEAPMGLVMGLNASSATAGQIVGPLAGYSAFEIGGAHGLGMGCAALGIFAALGLHGLKHD